MGEPDSVTSKSLTKNGVWGVGLQGKIKQPHPKRVQAPTFMYEITRIMYFFTHSARNTASAIFETPDFNYGVPETCNPKPATLFIRTSLPAANGLKTILKYQTVGTTRYFDTAGFPGRTVGL